MKKERSALLITYYWPPAGGAGVHRWLRFSTFFKENGWKLHVYCPQDAAWPTIDKELENQVSPDLTVIRKPIFEPHKYLGKSNNPNVGAGLTQKGKSSFFQRFVIWTRGNLFIPDARVFWIRPSVRFLRNYLREHPEIDTIISTGPPHSTHLIAKALRHKNSIQWIADFRDPWTEIDFYHDLLPGKWADNRHHALELSVLKEADKIVTISEACADGLEKIAQRKVHVITNGFNFPEFDAKKVDLDSDFTIAHFGSMPAARNPESVWKALSQLIKENQEFSKDLKIRLIGPLDFSVNNSLSQYGLISHTEFVKSIPHSESILQQRKSQILLLVANQAGNVKGILTGKFFEYLGAKRPILALGEKDSNLEEVMNNTKAGLFATHDDSESIKQFILKSYSSYKENNLYHQAINIEQFSSRQLAKDFIRLMEQ